MTIATFDYAVWAARYPVLGAVVAEPLATAYFGEACIYLDNTDCSPVVDAGVRLTLLSMLVSHIAAINGATAAGAAGLVGRIASATEGSVTVQTDFTATPGSEKWFSQTQYGASYWAAIAPYRTMNYVPAQQPYLGVPGYGGGYPWPQ